MLNEKTLDEKLDTIEKVRPWSSRLISKIETLIRSGDDRSLFRINPLQFGLDKNVSEQEAIDLFLHSAKAGLFNMNWELICPRCGGTIESLKALKLVNSHFFCNTCDVKVKVEMDDYIQVTFTINPEVRTISYHDPDSLSAEDYVLNYHFSTNGKVSNGMLFTEMIRPMQRALAFIQPGDKQSFNMDVEDGALVFWDLISDTVIRGFFNPNAHSDEKTISLIHENNEFRLNNPERKSGNFIIEIENRNKGKILLAIFQFTQFMLDNRPDMPLTFDPFLTGKRILSNQTFRDLFRNEVIQDNEGLNVRELTVLFTDLKGSTSLYERIGDLKAFNLVRQHFDSLGKVVRDNSGAIVKTIGDAVMATFETSKKAVKASLEMLNEIEQFNKSSHHEDLILKIGIHRGALIAVTLNDRLDYFGQTVNIAARVQGLADAEQIYITSEVYKSDGVSEVLNDIDVVPTTALLKGIEDEMQVYRIAHHTKQAIAV